MRHLIFLLICIIINPSTFFAIWSQELKTNNTLIGISEFRSYHSVTTPVLSQKILVDVLDKMKLKGLTVKVLEGSSPDSLIGNAKSAGVGLFIDGYYQKDTKTGNINIYSQIYNVETGKVIDAFNVTSEPPELDGIKLDSSEMQVEESKVINEFSKKITLRVKSNSKKAVRQENIEEYVIAAKLNEELNLPLPKEDLAAAADQVFKILQEDDSISIVSKRVGQSESVSRTSAIVSVISRSKIQDSGARNLADLLKQVPGVEVFYDQFGSYEVSFRGIRSRSGVLMLLDGHRINNFYDGSTFLDIRADVIEKVEVIRGPGSSVHGTNAFVGVINVVTKQNTDSKKSGGTATIRYGTQNTLEPSAFFSKTFGDSGFRLWGLASKYTSDRNKIALKHDDSCTPSDWSKLNCQKAIIPIPINPIYTNDRKDQYNVFLNSEYKDNFFINTKMIGEKRGPHVGEISQITPESELGSRLLLGSAGVKSYPVTKWFSISAKAYGDMFDKNDNIEVERRDMKTHLGVSARKTLFYRYETKGAEAVAQFTITDKLTFMLGGQYEKLSLYNFYTTKNYLRDSTSPLIPVLADFDYVPKGQIRSRFIQAAFGQFLWDPFHWMSLTLGVRYDEYSDFGKTINPKSGIVLVPFEKTPYGSLTFKILYGSAFRAPTFQELYDQTQAWQVGGVYGNKDLRPEIISTGEAGMEYQTPYKPLSFLINGFVNKINRNIEGVNTSGVNPTKNDFYRNLKGLDVIGAESEVRLSFSPKNYGFINGSWAQVVDRGGIPGGPDGKTYRLDIPQARMNVGVNHELTKYFNLNNSVWISSERASNSRFAFETQPGRTFRMPQHAIWNLSLGTTDELVKNITFRLSVFNVLDYKLSEDANIALAVFPNRSVPSSYLWGRYMEFKLVYQF